MKKLLIVLLTLTLCACNANTSEKKVSNKAYQIINSKGETLETRFNTPKGYKRINDNNLGKFLRNYPLYEDGYHVYLYNGKRKMNQNAHMAVFKLPIENYDLQQCADSVIRVYAEYYWSINQKEKIKFHFVDGFLCSYDMWRKGYRVSFSGKTHYVKTSSYDDSYENLVKYLKIVFAYASTLSLDANSKNVNIKDLQIGDMFIKGGSPGHVVMVVDICEKDNKKAFLLAQGYMPAQQFHVIKNPKHTNDPWYYEDEVTYPFKTAEYTFNKNSLKRLGEINET